MGASVEVRPRLILVDGHALVYRAFHAIPASFMTSRGEPTNAVYGFTSMLLKVLNEQQPEYCAVTFDLSTPTFRHLAAADYKATRPRMSDDLRSQFRRVREVVRAFNIPVYELEGYEADDVLGALATQAEAAGVDTVIVTGDMDTLQLVNDHVRVLAPRGRISETVLFDAAVVKERYGVDPAQVPDLKALAGDVSDNIKGVSGIGEKTAAKLLQDFATVEGLYARLDEVPAKWRQRLAEHEHLVRGNKALATIDRRAPSILDLEPCRLADYDRAAALALFQELEFRTLVDKLPQTAAPGKSRGTEQGARQSLLFDRPAAAPAATTEASAMTTATAAPNLITTAIGLETVVAILQGVESFILHPIAVQHSVVDHTLAGIALALDETRAWYVPVDRSGGAGALSESDVLAALRPVLEDGDIGKVGHNAKVIVTILAERGVTLRGLSFDTMVAGYLLNPSNRTVTVKNLVFQQLGREILSAAALAPKGGDVLSVPPDELGGEAMLEARLVSDLAASLSRDLAERDQLELFRTVELPLIPVLSDMERAGIKVDVRVLGEMARELATQIREIELAIYNDVGHQFTINSPQQLAKVLVDELHLPLTKRTKTGYSTDATVLEELSGSHPVIEHVLAYRQLTKLKSTYVDALPELINARTGRVHTTFNQAVAATGRLSSDSPNLQNIPVRTELGRGIRRAFVAGEPGMVLFAADYAQIELRIAAHMTRDPLLIEAFRQDEDIHTATAATVFNVPREQVTTEQRRLAKTTNFAVLYGIGEFGLSQRLGIARSEAGPFLKAHLEKFAGIRSYFQNTLKQARDRGYVETPLGRRRYVPELRAPNAGVRAAGERMAINMPIQGAQADLIKLAMIAVADAMSAQRLRSRMLLQVHDELVFEAQREELDALARLVRRCMEEAMALIVPIKVEMKVGENWLDMAPFA
ncbi:MAG: DNA polymerase I [Chloroflexota bacterium]|nr:DNA polymerase I [Chloroflexota bacterium]